MDQVSGSGTTYVIKTPTGVTVPMSAASAQAGKPVLTQQGNTVQLVNMPIRPGGPQKGIAQPQRLIINSPGVRPGVPGGSQMSLQALQQMPGGGHILIKTDTGQLQLIRVGPAPAQPGASPAPQFRLQPVRKILWTFSV